MSLLMSLSMNNNELTINYLIVINQKVNLSMNNNELTIHQ